MNAGDRLDRHSRRLLEDLASIGAGDREDDDSLEALASAAGRVETPAELRDAVLRSAARGSGLENYASRVAHFYDIDLEDAKQLLRSARETSAEGWFSERVGVRVRTVAGGPRVEGAYCLLVEIQPDVRYPPHRHLGDEWNLFLQGRCMDGALERNPGDLVRNTKGSSHPVLETFGDEPCVLAVVLYEGLDFAEQSVTPG